jgi:PGF-pre-PGF domain-containing protein
LQGETKNISFSLTPDNGGKMEVKVVVDSEDALHEINETNNQLIKEINVNDLRPDLKVESISLSPESPKLGENINFVVTIKNDGPGDAPGNKLKYNITGVNETYSGEISVSALSAGNSTKSTFSWIPGNEGQIEIKVMVDADSTVPEVEETNNEIKKTAIVSKETDSSSSESSGSSSSSSSGSSGSSSGSAGSSIISKEPLSNVESKEISTSNIANGYHVKFDFAENAACITYIEFDPKKTFKRTTTTVEILKNKSIFVSEIPLGKIYKYVNIWVGDKGAGLPASLETGFVGFKVEKSWIKENNINQYLITLQRFEKSWQLLDTEKVKEDKNYVYFKSKTPGFSCFVITEYKVDEKSNLEVSGQMETQETLKNWQGEVITSIFNESAEKDNKNENPMKKAKILVAISLPLFMILVEYFILKKKI